MAEKAWPHRLILDYKIPCPQETKSPFSACHRDLRDVGISYLKSFYEIGLSLTHSKSVCRSANRQRYFDHQVPPMAEYNRNTLKGDLGCFASLPRGTRPRKKCEKGNAGRQERKRPTS